MESEADYEAVNLDYRPPLSPLLTKREQKFVKFAPIIIILYEMLIVGLLSLINPGSSQYVRPDVACQV